MSKKIEPTDEQKKIMAALAQFKIDNPHVDWDVYEAYAIQNNETGKVERLSWIRKDRLAQMNLGTGDE